MADEWHGNANTSDETDAVFDAFYKVCACDQLEFFYKSKIQSEPKPVADPGASIHWG